MNTFDLFIDSADRTANSTSSCDFNYQLKRGLSTANYTKCKLVYINLPNNVYNVRSGINDKIDFSEGGGELNATLTSGIFEDYSGVDGLLAEIKTQMDSVGGQAYTVSLDENTKLITISAPGNFSILWSSGTNSSTSARKLLGWTLADTTAATTTTATNQPRLGYPDYYQLYVSSLSNDLECSNGKSASFIIPITTNSFSSIILNEEDLFNQVRNFNNDTNNINIQLRYDGVIADLLGRDFSFCLRFY